MFFRYHCSPVSPHVVCLDRFYDAPDSCSKVASFESFEDGHCFSNGGGTSFKFDFPTEFFYPVGSTCTAGTATGTQNLTTSCTHVDTYPIAAGGDHLAYKWEYGNVKFDDSSSQSTLSTAEIAGISAGGAVAVVGLAAAGYYFLGSSASGAATAASGGATANPMVSAV
jgi:hypothetical protein